MEQNPHEAQEDGSDESPNSPSMPKPLPLRLWMQPNGLLIELTEPDNLVGRHSSADLRLPLPDVSRRHCRFVCTSGRWQIVDLESLNGVYVNDQRVDQADLQDGDQIRLGSFTFAVELARPGILSDGLVRRLFPARPARVFLNPHRRAS